MKKILFSLIIAGFFVSVNAQTVVFEENFDNGEFPMGWQNVDVDGDGFTWSVVQIQNEFEEPLYTPLMRSFSWNSFFGPLLPDNWAITYGIDLSEYTGNTISLNWDVMAADANYDHENYTVYVGTSGDYEDLFDNAVVTFNEPTLDGVNEPTPRTIDISELGGETIYIAFRHHGTTDVFSMEIDNVQVIVEESMGVNDQLTRNTTNVFPNPVNELLNIRLADGFDKVNTKIQVVNMAGQSVASFNFNEVINLSKIPAGVYVLTLTDGKKSESKKLIKK